MIYTVTFNPAIDYVAEVDGTLTLGDINRTCSEAVQFGGKGINVSNVLNRLDVDTVALGFVAGFTGKGLEQGLQKMGLKTDFIHLSQGLTRINVKIKAGQETDINGLGPAISEADMEKLYAQLERLEKDDVLVLSGSIPASLKSDTYEQIMARLQEKQLCVVVDATKDLLLNVLKYRPFLIKPNDRELGEIFGMHLSTDQQIISCAGKLQEMGGRNILVSMAGSGALLLDEDGCVHRIGCPEGRVVNSVGAGDSMVAGFLAGYQKTKDYDYALRLGTAAGSATAFSLGLAQKEQIEKLVAQLEN